MANPNEAALSTLQAVGPVAITSLILSNGLVDLIPGAEDNDDPNMPYDPEAQYAYNSAAIQARPGTCLASSPA